MVNQEMLPATRQMWGIFFSYIAAQPRLLRNSLLLWNGLRW